MNPCISRLSHQQRARTAGRTELSMSKDQSSETESHSFASKFAKAVKRKLSAFNATLPLSAKIISAGLILLLGWMVVLIAQERATEARADYRQQQRDEDAEFYSYWPTTVRVDTDMDSSWLPDEERTCQTYPDDKGRVASVACNSSVSHRDHNIPVKFWGGVDRNAVSEWKCRREKDEFVCRAIN